MFTVKQSIDYIRNKIRETSDDSEYSDQFIYDTLLMHRNVLLKRELDKKKKEDQYLWTPYGMPLCVGTWHDCDCIPNLGCPIVESKYKVPRYFAGYLRVTNLTGTERYNDIRPHVGKWRKYARTNAMRPYWAMFNEKIHFFNVVQNTWRMILLEFIPEDPLAVSELPVCSPDGTETPCSNPYDVIMNLSAHLFEPLMKMTLESIMPSLKLKEDNTNNADSDVLNR